MSVEGDPRNATTFEQRLAWHDCCERHAARGTFKRRLRMSKESFDKLLSYIHDDLKVDEAQAHRRGGAIIPECEM